MSITVRRKADRDPHAKKAVPKSGADAKALAEAFSRESGPPGATSTTTPAGIRAFDPAAREAAELDKRRLILHSWAQSVQRSPRYKTLSGIEQRVIDMAVTFSDLKEFQLNQVAALRDALEGSAPSAAPKLGHVFRVALDQCDPHPDNVERTEAEIQAMAESLAAEHQKEPAVVRRVGNRWQILSGHRRYYAALRLGWRELDARERFDCDDDAALDELASYNGERKNLHPIARAQLVEKLVARGRSLQEAARRVGLESVAAASNLRRLLQLPAVWQERVASRQLPESFARLLVPYASVKPLMEAFDADYVKQQKMKRGHYDQPNPWDSRKLLEEHLDELVEKHTRPIDDTTKRYYRGVDFPKKFQSPYRYSGDYPRLFALTPDIEAQLDIVELPIEGKPTRVAANAAVYDKHQYPAIKQFVDQRERRQSAKQGQGQKKSGEKAKLTPAEERRKREQAAQQLKERIRGWRHRLLRRELQQRIVELDDSGMRLVLAVMADVPPGVHLGKAVATQLGANKDRPVANPSAAWRLVRHVLDASTECATIRAIALHLLALESDDPRRPRLPFGLVDAYAEDLQVDVAAAWDRLKGGAERDPLLEQFYLLHNRQQLEALGQELGVHLGQAKTRAAAVKLLLSIDRLLPLPKSLQPAERRTVKAKGKQSKPR